MSTRLVHKFSQRPNLQLELAEPANHEGRAVRNDLNGICCRNGLHPKKSSSKRPDRLEECWL